MEISSNYTNFVLKNNEYESIKKLKYIQYSNLVIYISKLFQLSLNKWKPNKMNKQMTQIIL